MNDVAQAGSMPIVQNCWVVDDLEQAMQAWIAVGVGPFFRLDIEAPDARYRGATVPLSFRAAVAQAGGIQIELIEQSSEGPSAYRESFPKGTSGFHHVCRAPGRYDATVAALRAQGVELVTEATLGELRFCYADTRATLGCMLEIVDERAFGTWFAEFVAKAAIDWDGSDPIRALPLA